MSEAAREAWYRRFDRSHFELKRNSPEPFSSSKRLGEGGCGFVYEIILDGIPLALKRQRFKKITDDTKQEIDMLKRVSKNRHEHLVELIGSYSYTEKRQGSYELGIVIWPVAQYDLAHFMSELDILGRFLREPLPDNHSEDLGSVVDTLTALTGVDDSAGIGHLYELSLMRLSSYFACIAEGLAWLHGKVRVRHRDLRPAQILVSADGLWLTDFGLSKYISNLDRSATSGTESTTKRYEAPERASGARRGRAEDIFGLGCIYFEMTYVFSGIPLEKLSSKDKNAAWSFQLNVTKDIKPWTSPLRSHDSPRAQHLAVLLERLLTLQPDRRPSLIQVLEHLSVSLPDGFEFFSPCCKPQKPKALEPLPSTSKLEIDGTPSRIENLSMFLSPPHHDTFGVWGESTLQLASSDRIRSTHLFQDPRTLQTDSEHASISVKQHYLAATTSATNSSSLPKIRERNGSENRKHSIKRGRLHSTRKQDDSATTRYPEQTPASNATQHLTAASMQRTSEASHLLDQSTSSRSLDPLTFYPFNDNKMVGHHFTTPQFPLFHWASSLSPIQLSNPKYSLLSTYDTLDEHQVFGKCTQPLSIDYSHSGSAPQQKIRDSSGAWPKPNSSDTVQEIISTIGTYSNHDASIDVADENKHESQEHTPQTSNSATILRHDQVPPQQLLEDSENDLIEREQWTDEFELRLWNDEFDDWLEKDHDAKNVAEEEEEEVRIRHDLESDHNPKPEPRVNVDISQESDQTIPRQSQT